MLWGRGCILVGVSRCVSEVGEPTAGCAVGWDRCPWEGEPLGLAAWAARDTLNLTMGCDARLFFNVCFIIIRLFFWIPGHATSETVILLKRYLLGMYGAG